MSNQGWSKQYRPKSKYHNVKVHRIVDGKTKTIDSKREARRYDELRLLERSGQISGLKTQVRYRLIPSQRGPDGRVVERPCDYVADFVYTDKTGHTVVEDAKGRRTEAYIIKRKLMLYIYGIHIQEV